MARSTYVSRYLLKKKKEKTTLLQINYSITNNNLNLTSSLITKIG